MKIRLLTIVLLLVLTGAVQAQNLVVKSFEPVQMETISEDDWKHDLDGDYCALVKVRVGDRILEDNTGNIVGKPNVRNREQWVFLTSGTKIFKLSFSSHYPLTIETSKWGIPRLEGKRIYVLTLVEEQPGQLPKPVATAPSVRLMLHYAHPLTGPLTLNGSDVLTNANSSGMTIGLDAGFLLTKADAAFRLYGFAGLGLTKESMKLGHNVADYSFTTDQDIDGETYSRHYKNLKLKQEISVSQLTIPVYLNAEYALGDMAVYANLGLRVNMCMSKKLEDDGSTVSSVYGMYDDGLNEKSSIDWAKDCGTVNNLGQNANGFGDNMKSLDNPVYNDIDGVTSTSIDLLAGAGVRYTIPNSPLTIDLGINFIFGLGDLISPSDDAETKKYVYNKIGSDLKSTEYVNCLTNQLESVKRQATMLSVGLIFNL